MATIHWDGVSGSKYKYLIYPLPIPVFNSTPGNYVFVKETEPGSYRPIYVGETSDLSERFDNHHKMPCIQSEGATHITVHTSGSNADTRRAEESDIVNKWSPTCNG